MRYPTLWESTSLLLVLILPTYADQNLIQAVQNSRNFSCKEPQNRAYNLQDLMQEVQQNSAETPTHPAYIILKRCDAHSGCCHTTEMSCFPVTSWNYFEDVEIRIWNVETNKTRNIWIRIEQHRKCACEESNISDRIAQESRKPRIKILSP
ncbi:uncharacterized protein LOC117167763 [Belonocnema kinseyi]|uniref:uncharacterized protein LOC117167763 n=1 Tax=Belonocnema kinseyi TaxID=2817044 RepID=UPI00143D2502|nr:uncharacterized protein LOC117167763 [Belonocnema kinseyi]